MNWWMPESGVSEYDGIILDGSIRAGKSLPESTSYIDWAMFTYSGENLGMAGKTLGALRRNVIAPLKRVLPGRGYKVRDIRSAEMPHLEVSKGRKSNYFHLFGGNNEKSQDPVQGFTGGGFYFDEVALMPQSFVNQAEGRCSLDESKFWYNCNPEGPYNYVKLEYLDKLKEKNLLHLHFSMDDNLSLTPRTRARYERRWSRGSVFYRRFILGQWCLAEGLIFDFFSTRVQDGYVVDHLPDDLKSWLVAADYGQDHPTCFGLAGYSPSMSRWYLVKELYLRDKTNPAYVQEFKKHILGYGTGIYPIEVNIDPGGGGTSLIKQFSEDMPNISVCAATKKDVAKEIQQLATAMFLKKFSIYLPGCPRVVAETANYAWDKKAGERGEDKPLKKDDDGPDMLRYLWQLCLRYS